VVKGFPPEASGRPATSPEKFSAALRRRDGQRKSLRMSFAEIAEKRKNSTAVMTLLYSKKRKNKDTFLFFYATSGEKA
jgi:hypothetical protein